MSSEKIDNVMARVQKALDSNGAITYGPPIADNEHPEITWQCYGLVASNEIALIARCGELEIGARQESPLLIPPIADRGWGMDVADEELASRLGDEIWSRDGYRLLAEALRIRSSKDSSRKPSLAKQPRGKRMTKTDDMLERADEAMRDARVELLSPHGRLRAAYDAAVFGALAVAEANLSN